MNNSRFAVAVHVLTLLAIEDRDEPTTSDYLAHSANTNPVVVRRLLVLLRKAGLVNAQPGVGGGVSLRRRPEQITLLDVYCAIGKDSLFSISSRKPASDCICGRNIQPVLTDVFYQAEVAAHAVLAEISLAQIARKVEERDRRREIQLAPRSELLAG